MTRLNNKITKFNFFKGHPSPYLLPTKEVLEAANTSFQKVIDNPSFYDDVDNRHPLTYGTDPGNLEVRSAIAKWNDRNFKLNTPTNPDCINLTGGASYGIMNILTQATSPHNNYTKQAFLVTPTYFLINGSFIDAGFGGKLTGVEEFANGDIDLEFLESKIKYFNSLDKSTDEEKLAKLSIIKDTTRVEKKIYEYVLYITPNFSNPKGGILSDDCKIKLVNLARKYDILIIADDVYDLLDYSRPYNEIPNYHKRLVYVDRETMKDQENGYGNTISNGTFSKLIGPGLRVGWQESVNPKLANILAAGGAHRSGGSPSQANTVIVGELLQSGSLDKIISNLRKVYSERAKTMIESIKEYLPQGTEISGGEGGYFFWITLPKGYDCRKICQECDNRGVVLANGDHFEVIGDSRNWGDSSVRISISVLNNDEIKNGVKIWGEVCKDLYP
ncbi:hypothetical protein B5S28_g4695 [[Candida] boidinii]|nr:hypothetical protein B5S28_g4695 [[Candida] boidinii]